MNPRTRYILVMLCAVWLTASAQIENRKPTGGSDIPEFFMDAISFAAADSAHSRLDVYLHVPYDVLRFVSSDGGYRAQYEATVSLLTEENTVIVEKTVTEEVRHRTYEETEKRAAYNLTQRSFDIAPGSYIIRAQVRDLESKKTAIVVKKIVVDSYAAPVLSMSDIMLISRVTSENGRLNIVPNISGNIADVANGFYVFYEVYNGAGIDSIESIYTISSSKQPNVFSQRVVHAATSKKVQVIEKLDTAKYASGSYTLTIEVRAWKSGAEGEEKGVQRKKIFVARWGNMPFSIIDLDLAVRQTRYIAKDKEFEEMNEAPTSAEKQRLFHEFWQRHDPSPDTKRNEYMEEYYSRVEYANEHFSHYLAGWRTDMGMVFILLGSPNNVERHPFDIDSKPYEVWSYYDYNRSLIFADDTGFGDYKLLTPIYDILQRIK